MSDLTKLTVAEFIVQLQQERDALDEAIKLMLTVAKLVKGKSELNNPPIPIVAKAPSDVAKVSFDFVRTPPTDKEEKTERLRRQNYSEADLADIKKLYMDGEQVRLIAKKYNVATHQIFKLIYNRKWSQEKALADKRSSIGNG